MYQPHSIAGFIVGFLLFGFVSALGAVWHARTNQKTLNPKLFLPVIFAALSLLGGFSTRRYDVSRLREEFQKFTAAQINALDLARGGQTLSLTNSVRIASLINAAQSLKSIPGHHSSPTNPVTLRFQIGEARYTYEIGKDSQLSSEFWVHWQGPAPTEGSAIEIGRFESPDYEKLVDEVMLNAK